MRASASDCGDAEGEVSSRYSTPKSSSRVAINAFCSGVKWAKANCSPSRSVDSMMLNAVMVMGTSEKYKKPSSIGTRGSLSRYHPTSPSPCEDDLLESAARSPEDSGLITEATRLGLVGATPRSPAAPRPFSAVPWTLPLSCRRFSVVPASAYSPSSTPLNMNLLGQTIAVPRGACQATAA